MTTIDEYLAAQRAEWGKYVATQPIDIGGARAFNPGDPVPAGHLSSGAVAPGQVKAVDAPAPEQPADPVADDKPKGK